MAPAHKRFEPIGVALAIHRDLGGLPARLCELEAAVEDGLDLQVALGRELTAACAELGSHLCLSSGLERPSLIAGGEDIAGVWCVLDGAYTQIGPLCEDEACHAEGLAAACAELEGTDIGDGAFCVVSGTYEVVDATSEDCVDVGVAIAGADLCVLDVAAPEPGSDSAGRVTASLLLTLAAAVAALL